jgi:hypothetical protein
LLSIGGSFVNIGFRLLFPKLVMFGKIWLHWLLACSIKSQGKDKIPHGYLTRPWQLFWQQPDFHHPVVMFSKL